MHGNVWEWCQDWFGDYPSKAAIDPGGSSGGSDRVFRGGSWNNFAGYCRTANRFNFWPDSTNLNVGFRLVFSPGQ